MFCVKIIQRQINRLQCRLKPKDGVVKNWCDNYYGITNTVQSYEGKNKLEPMNGIMYRWTSTMLNRWMPAFADRHSSSHFFLIDHSLFEKSIHLQSRLTMEIITASIPASARGEHDKTHRHQARVRLCREEDVQNFVHCASTFKTGTQNRPGQGQGAPSTHGRKGS